MTYLQSKARTVAPCLLALLVLFCCQPAFAAEAAPGAVDRLVSALLEFAGALATLFTALAAVLPKRLRLTKFLARWGADIRGHLRDPDESTPESPKSSSILMVLLVCLVVAPIGCTPFKRIDYPRKLECLRELPSGIVGAVARGVTEGDWMEQLHKLEADHSTGVVLCAARQIIEDITQETGAAPDTRLARARLELYLAEAGTEFAE